MDLIGLKNKFIKLPKWIKFIYYAVLFEIGLLICFNFEVPVFYNISKLNNISGMREFFIILKEVGHFRTWVIISILLLLFDLFKRTKGNFNCLRRAEFLLSSALISGLVAEILKLIIRRERPQPLYFTGAVFRDWTGAWWKSNNLGTPSSHAMVAFGATWALCILFPKARIVWIFIGITCALSRMVHQAHLLGDVYIACVLSYLIVKILENKILYVKSDKIKINDIERD